MITQEQIRLYSRKVRRAELEHVLRSSDAELLAYCVSRSSAKAVQDLVIYGASVVDCDAVSAQSVRSYSRLKRFQRQHGMDQERAK